MAGKSAKVDAYIEKSPAYAQPILKKVRALFHRGCPTVEESFKWGRPSFEYKGMLGGMAAFKEHVVWGFWKGSLLKDPTNAMQNRGAGMGGGCLSDVSQLPPDKIIIDLIKQAVELNEKGMKLPPRKVVKRPPLKTPPDLAAALKKNAKAAKTFEGFSPSHKREYIEWITEAKQEATRARRLAQAIEWVAAGKPRNWKYM
jgi:uncharacterized protein YdeI (YjbR/CyaY-like superfamily)